MIEVLYTFFIFSGYIKSYFPIWNVYLPIDFTLFFMVLLIIVSIKNYKLISFYYFRYISLLFLFYTWLIFTLIYTSSETYSLTKVFLFLTNIIAFIYPLILYKKFSIESFFKYSLVITSVLNIYFVLYILPRIYLNDLFYTIHGNYLTVSLLSGLNILVLLIYKIKFKYTSFNYIFLIINFMTLFLSGGRSGLVFSLIILLLFSLTKVKLKKIKPIRIFQILIFLLIIIYISYVIFEEYSDLFNRSFSRLSLIFDALSGKDGGNSIDHRLHMISFSIENIFSSIHSFIFGSGIGSFSYEYTGIDGRGYPHNIVLEILFESGFIGLILFMSFLFYTISNKYQNVFGWIFLYLTLNALKSNGLVDLRLYFSILALMLIYSKKKQLKGKKC